MNDPKDIVVTISIGKEDNSLNQTITEENKENQILNKELRFNNLMFHLRENLSKKLYKKTIKEIDVLFQKNYIDGYSRSWKLSILKIKAILKIIKHKIIKYLINHFEKIKIKHHINGIKRYFSNALSELNKFFENNEDANIINDEEIVDDLLYCYYDYIYLISFLNKILGNIIESISYLSFILSLNKETKLVVKSPKTIYKIEKCFILLSQILICNEDYFSSIEYLNIAMSICLKNIIYQTKDIGEGLLREEKREIINNKIKNEKVFENKKIKKSILNIVLIYFYRGVCYENLGKLKNSIRCYSQCQWFINNFLINNFIHFSDLINHILEKSIELKETVDYLHKRIRIYEYLQLTLKNQNEADLDKEEKKGNHILSKSLCSKKFKGLVNKLGKLKINEIDTVNKFDVKKNIKSLSLRRREGKDKNIFLSEIRLLNTYLREDFRVIIDDMDKIKSFDLDYSTREKIQKLVRKLYFEQNQKKLNSIKKDSLCLSSRNLDNKIGKMIRKGKVQSNKYYPLTLRLTNLKKEKIKINKSKSLSFKQSRSKSAYARDNNSNLDSKNIINDSELKKSIFLKKYRKIKQNSVGALSKIEEENLELNRFFNKKYLSKRNYIKKLEDRELTFQKNVLRLKNTPKIPIKSFSKEVIKQNVKNYYDKAMTLLLGPPNNWKENLSEEEIKNIINYNKLENAVIKSLDKNILIKFDKEKKKYRNNRNYIIEGINNSLSDIRNNNKNIIEKLNLKLEELRHREILENKNYNNLLMKNRAYLKRINKGNLLYKTNYDSNRKLKKSLSQSILNDK